MMRGFGTIQVRIMSTESEVGRESGAAEARALIGAVSVFVFRGDRLLALKRSAKSDAAAGAWDAVSGRLHQGEHPRDAALRETREETGLEAAIDEVPVVSYCAKRGETPMLVVAYRAESAPGEVTISAEHDEFAWMTIDEFSRACKFALLVDAARKASARGGVPAGEHVVLWEYRVKPGREAEFESIYGSDGEWARLFRRDHAYRGTELLRVSTPRGYITIDRWSSSAAYDSFLKRFRKEYDALDRRTAHLTERDHSLGRLERVPSVPGLRPETGPAKGPDPVKGTEAAPEAEQVVSRGPEPRPESPAEPDSEVRSEPGPDQVPSGEPGPEPEQERR
jgi:8-oxo-dGTP diphosphatase